LRSVGFTYRANNWLSDKGTHGAWPNTLELCIELGCKTSHVISVRLVLFLATIRIARRNMRCVLGQERLKRLSPEYMSTYAQSTERGAVIRGQASDESGSLRLRCRELEEILSS
jgi:hypothetical protein